MVVFWDQFKRVEGGQRKRPDYTLWESLTLIEFLKTKDQVL